jgi:hypothetical protein
LSSNAGEEEQEIRDRGKAGERQEPNRLDMEGYAMNCTGALLAGLGTAMNPVTTPKQSI